MTQRRKSSYGSWVAYGVVMMIGFSLDKWFVTDASGQPTVGFRMNLNDVFLVVVMGFVGVAILLMRFSGRFEM